MFIFWFQKNGHLLHNQQIVKTFREQNNSTQPPDSVIPIMTAPESIPATLCTRWEFTLSGMPIYHRASSSSINDTHTAHSINPYCRIHVCGRLNKSRESEESPYRHRKNLSELIRFEPGPWSSKGENDTCCTIAPSNTDSSYF